MFKRFFANIGYNLARPFIRLFMIIFLNPKGIDKNNIPRKGGVILAGNHISYYDPFIVGSFTLRPMHFLAKKELMDIKFVSHIFKFFGLIRVDRSKKNPDATRQAVECLQKGEVICIFPEGTTKKNAPVKILPFKYGAVSFAKKTGCPIVPFAIINQPKMFKYNTKIIYGKPYYVIDDDLEKEKNILETKVLELLEKGKMYEKTKRNS